jgi:hypothetical protein
VWLEYVGFLALIVLIVIFIYVLLLGPQIAAPFNGVNDAIPYPYVPPTQTLYP